MHFENSSCSAALKKAAPIVHNLALIFSKISDSEGKKNYLNDNFPSFRIVDFAENQGQACLLWEPLFLARLNMMN